MHDHNQDEIPNLYHLQRYAKENYLFDPINFYFFYNSKFPEEKIKIRGVDSESISDILKKSANNAVKEFNIIIEYFNDEILKLINSDKIICYGDKNKVTTYHLPLVIKYKENDKGSKNQAIKEALNEFFNKINIVKCIMRTESDTLILDHKPLFYLLRGHDLKNIYYQIFYQDKKDNITNSEQLSKQLENYLYEKELFIPLELEWIIADLCEEN